MSDLGRFTLTLIGLLALFALVRFRHRLLARLLVLAFAALLGGDTFAMLPPAAPVVVIEENVGGSVPAFAAQIAEYRKRHVSVRIEGDCASSCTMLAALPPTRLCVGPNADLRFHQAFHPHDAQFADTTDRSEPGTAELMRHYPPALRAWIASKGGLGPDLITLEGAELRAFFRTCAGESGATLPTPDRSYGRNR